ncbi:MAG TPA: ATP-grasp domain-containing protein, partial [Myxococcales bacterium]|nr:ATP-grasp domain-containing protein [Myxococcales bacterium]
MSANQFNRVVVLNRGEAAVRFIRAARTWSRIHNEPLDVVALYTTPDKTAPFVRMASHAIPLGEPLVPGPNGGMRSAYLDIERIIRLAKKVDATALWPGWGFLAESAELAAACKDAGITFIGPSARAIQLLGDKIEAKRLAEQHGVPVSAWSGGAVDGVANARKAADKIGYPAILKATAGGGGRGIRIVRSPDDLEDAYHSASTEAANAFGNPDLLVEQFVPVARHVEVQILADSHGTVWALGTRDCSMQRRHQKVLEEAPAPALKSGVEERLCEAAIVVAKASNYEGAGTAEFLLDPETQNFFFLEMNTRLQVEHTVTEAIYDVDLVVKQIEIAMGKALPSAEPPEPRGVAIEARLNAEDPDAGFTPSAGKIIRFDAPQGPGIRVDSGFAAGGVIPSEFDSNIAKLIAKGSTRLEAIARLETALRDTTVAISGGPTNRSLLIELLSNADFKKGAVTTRWLDDHLNERPPATSRPGINIALAAAAIGDHLRARRGTILNFLASAQGGLPSRVALPEATRLRYLVGGVPVSVTVATLGPSRFRVTCGEGAMEFLAENTGQRSMILEENGRRHSVIRIGTPTAVHVDVDGVAHRFTRTSDGRV